VPMFTCGFVRSNFAFAMVASCHSLPRGRCPYAYFF
jgi:hypothetical protein